MAALWDISWCLHGGNLINDSPDGIDVPEQWPSQLQARLAKPIVPVSQLFQLFLILRVCAHALEIDARIASNLVAQPNATGIQTDKVKTSQEFFALY
jgi:hypothetical protein